MSTQSQLDDSLMGHKSPSRGRMLAGVLICIAFAVGLGVGIIIGHFALPASQPSLGAGSASARSTAASANLIKNPELENNALGWLNHGGQLSYHDAGFLRVSQRTSNGQGPVTRVKVLRGTTYEAAVRLRHSSTQSQRLDVLVMTLWNGRWVQHDRMSEAVPSGTNWHTITLGQWKSPTTGTVLLKVQGPPGIDIDIDGAYFHQVSGGSAPGATSLDNSKWVSHGGLIVQRPRYIRVKRRTALGDGPVQFVPTNAGMPYAATAKVRHTSSSAQRMDLVLMVRSGDVYKLSAIKSTIVPPGKKFVKIALGRWIAPETKDRILLKVQADPGVTFDVRKASFVPL